MTSRETSRAQALQILYELDLNSELAPEKAVGLYEQCFAKTGAEVDPFCRELVAGVVENLEEMDHALRGIAENWRPERMSAIDRNIMRLGVFELLYCDDIPATVTLDQMIELAKQFGSEKSGAFVNGVLDKVRQAHPRPNKTP